MLHSTVANHFSSRYGGGSRLVPFFFQSLRPTRPSDYRIYLQSQAFQSFCFRFDTLRQQRILKSIFLVIFWSHPPERRKRGSEEA